MHLIKYFRAILGRIKKVIRYYFKLMTERRLYEEIIKSYPSAGYDEAQTLVKSSNWSESEKERVLKLLSGINDTEQAEEREGAEGESEDKSGRPFFFCYVPGCPFNRSRP